MTNEEDRSYNESSLKLVTRKADEGQSTKRNANWERSSEKEARTLFEFQLLFCLKVENSRFGYGIKGRSDPNSREPVVAV